MYNFRLVLYEWVLSIIGILVINSAADGFAAKQLIGFVGGSVVMIIFSLIDYNYIAKFEWYLYSINIGMLIAVKLFGISVNGARRWFSLGPFGTFQPSELSKVIMLIIFAHLISEQKDSEDWYFICDSDVSGCMGAGSLDNNGFCISVLYIDVCWRYQL